MVIIMLERRIWSNLPYILLLFLLCFTILSQLSMNLMPIKFVQHLNIVYTLYNQNSSGYTFSIDSLQSNDYNQLIDLNFTFKILNFPCYNSNNKSFDLLLLILVHSSPENFAKRKVIRETWGGGQNENFRLLFMIGLVDNNNLQKQLDNENDKYHDFIQGTFLDTYRNITYKHVMVFKYIIYHCSNVKYLLKTDDDVFVNLPLMINFLKNDLSPYGAANILFCTPRRNVYVLRTYRSKWRVSFNEYPKRNYPTYCPGWTLLYSPDIIFNLYKEAQLSDYFWIDDIHITGTLAKKIHATHTDIKRFVLTEKKYKHILNDNYNNILVELFLYGTPNANEKQIRILWSYVNSHEIPKSLLQDVQIIR